MSSATAPAPHATGTGRSILVLCFLCVLADGYDLGMYGAIVPNLLAYRPWSLTPLQAASFASLTLFGMLLGGLLVSTISPLLGPRRLLIAGVSWFTVFMVATGLAPTPGLFGLSRFLTGLGLGVVLPVAIALTVEFAPAHQRQRANSLLFLGWPSGAIVAALVSIFVVPSLGFRAMFFIGALSVVIIPVLVLRLPQSPAWLLSYGRTQEAEQIASTYAVDVAAEAAQAERARIARPRDAFLTLFRPRFLPSTLLYALAGFFALLVLYGIQTWLPTLMAQSGNSLGSALGLLLVLNIGLLVGTVIGAFLGDRVRPKTVVIGLFVVTAVAVALLGFVPTALAFGVVFVAGVGVSCQIALNGAIAQHYPAASRASALGWATGIARIGGISGPLLGTTAFALGFSVAWQFYLFAGFAILGLVAIALVPRAPVAELVESPEAPVRTRRTSSTQERIEDG